MQAKSERFELRLEQDVLDRVDDWRGRQSDLPSRSEAIRRLVSNALDSGSQPSISDGDRLIIAMLRDVMKASKVRGEIDADFVMSAISGGHLWGLEWEYVGLLHKHIDQREAVREVVDILDMWVFIERAHAALPTKEKEELAKEHVQSVFPGFDGNHEGEHMGIAHFLVDQLKRFSTFKGRDLNSHHPSLDDYRLMLRKFLAIRPKLVGREMTAAEIREVSDAR